MKNLLVGIIKLYRAFPDRYKRKCLFRESCSHFVLRMTRDKGFWAGCNAIYNRLCKCRPGYSIHFNYRSNDWEIEFVNGVRASGSEIADDILIPFRELIAPFVDRYRSSEADSSSNTLEFINLKGRK